jgi:hypothetical protein
MCIVHGHFFRRNIENLHESAVYRPFDPDFDSDPPVVVMGNRRSAREWLEAANIVGGILVVGRGVIVGRGGDAFSDGSDRVGQ